LTKEQEAYLTGWEHGTWSCSGQCSVVGGQEDRVL